jgi:hypothetical protein
MNNPSRQPICHCTFLLPAIATHNYCNHAPVAHHIFGGFWGLASGTGKSPEPLETLRHGAKRVRSPDHTRHRCRSSALIPKPRLDGFDSGRAASDIFRSSRPICAEQLGLLQNRLRRFLLLVGRVWHMTSF